MVKLEEDTVRIGVRSLEVTAVSRAALALIARRISRIHPTEAIRSD